MNKQVGSSYKLTAAFWHSKEGSNRRTKRETCERQGLQKREESFLRKEKGLGMGKQNLECTLQVNGNMEFQSVHEDVPQGLTSQAASLGRCCVQKITKQSKAREK